MFESNGLVERETNMKFSKAHKKNLIKKEKEEEINDQGIFEKPTKEALLDYVKH